MLDLKTVPLSLGKHHSPGLTLLLPSQPGVLGVLEGEFPLADNTPKRGAIAMAAVRLKYPEMGKAVKKRNLWLDTCGPSLRGYQSHYGGGTFTGGELRAHVPLSFVI